MKNYRCHAIFEKSLVRFSLSALTGKLQLLTAFKEGWLQATAIYATGGALGLDMRVRELD